MAKVSQGENAEWEPRSLLQEVKEGARGTDLAEETKEWLKRKTEQNRKSPKSPRRFSGRKEELRMSNATKGD